MQLRRFERKSEGSPCTAFPPRRCAVPSWSSIRGSRGESPTDLDRKEGQRGEGDTDTRRMRMGSADGAADGAMRAGSACRVRWSAGGRRRPSAKGGFPACGLSVSVCSALLSSRESRLNEVRNREEILPFSFFVMPRCVESQTKGFVVREHELNGNNFEG